MSLLEFFKRVNNKKCEDCKFYRPHIGRDYADYECFHPNNLCIYPEVDTNGNIIFLYEFTYKPEKINPLNNCPLFENDWINSILSFFGITFITRFFLRYALLPIIKLF